MPLLLSRGRRPALPALLALLCALCGAPAGAATLTASQMATCVAALKLHSEALAQRAREGRGGPEAELLQVLRQGATLVGAAYLDGHRDEDAAKAQLAQAEATVRPLSAAQQAVLRRECGHYADALHRAASSWQRAFIDAYARRRMERLLGRS